MSLLQDEQLENIENQGKSRQLYKIEFFLTVCVCIAAATFVLYRYVPEGESSVPITFEAILFAILLSMLSSPWAGRLIVVVFALACAIFVAVKINGFGSTAVWYNTASFYIWIIGAALFLLILIAWKAASFMNPDNKEAREYEKHMRKIGKW